MEALDEVAWICEGGGDVKRGEEKRRESERKKGWGLGLKDGE